jgi:hypothetical protein
MTDAWGTDNDGRWFCDMNGERRFYANMNEAVGDTLFLRRCLAAAQGQLAVVREACVCIAATVESACCVDTVNEIIEVIDKIKAAQGAKP